MVDELNSGNFNDAINAETPIVVDFFASWCGPCQALAPVFEKLAGEFEGKLRFAKVSTEKEESLAGENGVMSIPCLIVFNKGQEVDRIVGSMPEDALKAKLEEIIGKI